jgi:transcriptional regulator of aromatic amino acid metabolism
LWTERQRKINVQWIPQRDELPLLQVISVQGRPIFMDEVGEMSLRMQALLLRFLENGEIQRVGSDRVATVVDVRVIAATNRNVLAQVRLSVASRAHVRKLQGLQNGTRSLG